MWSSRIAFVIVLVSACSACAAPRFAGTRDGAAPLVDPPPATIDRFAGTYSNVYLLRARTPAAGAVLVDTGSPSDGDALEAAIARTGLCVRDLVVVLTHAHGDHAGNAARLKRGGAKIVLGRGDEDMARSGRNDEMSSTSLLAVVLKPFVRLDFEPFAPDIVVDDDFDLTAHGLPGVRVARMPGHTRGSVVVLVGRRDAITGDVMLGGTFGLPSETRNVGEHYYQHDPVRNHCNVQALLDAGIDRFHLMHGGSVDRETVERWRPAWQHELTACPRSPL